MKFIELVKKRQSVRKYLPKAVPREILERCLEAARLAPSACNSQPWSFIIVDNPKLKNELAEAAFSGIYSTNSFAKKAPVIIVVIREQSNYAARLGGYFRSIQYSLIDIGIAGEHLILQAAEEGLGTCWLGWFNEKAVKKILNLPKEKKIDLLISVGYAETEELRSKIRKPLNEISRFD
ncbi:MAG TPA: NAD(P)H nitroreductase [Elusimicrobia bacterium]|jgi:nitroreductase|nr:NAD(P)H nitroreductase [Elusimicrobiota bacterium]